MNLKDKITFLKDNDIPNWEFIALDMIDAALINWEDREEFRKTHNLIEEFGLESLHKGIYPLTVVKDRYDGTYTGGAFLAFKCKAGEVSDSIYGSDTHCHLPNKHKVGVGDTIFAAIKDLHNKIKKNERA